MPKECKKYQLRSTPKPARNCLLSTVVKVRDESGVDGYCYVGFDGSLVDAVGKKLPRGVAPYDPAFLCVEYDARRQVWVIGARYLVDESGVVLWESEAKPHWLKCIPLGGKHGNTKKNADGAGSANAGNARSPGPRRSAACITAACVES